jgi:phenylacetate-coenzyme A ligase PaaK-like adenylate-forming protein
VIFGGGGKNTFSVADPLDSIVGGLNRIQPGVLHVYASLIPRLILEAEAGRLKIEPACLLAGAEPLLEEHEELAVQTWGCPIFSNWGATEVGLLGSSSGFDPGLLLYDDHVIIEPVDIDGNPVEPGVRADKLLVTPLFHDVLPVLRYELTDQLTFLDESASCGSSFTRTSLVEARLHDSFTYEEGVHVHWHTFRAVFEQCRNVHEYQVHQTPAGALVKIVERGELDTPSVHGQLRESLQRLGLENPEIEIEIVPAIERTGSTLKIKRFVPLADPD